jgi:hypothetical protein
MELIDRYVREIGRQLPKNTRAEVEVELRSLLEDAVEDRFGPQQDVDEAQVTAVLREYGPPEKMVAAYQTASHYLIGPRLYPAFISTIKVILIIIGLLFFVSLAFSLSGSQVSLYRIVTLLIDTGTSLIDNAFMILGVVVLIFAVLERASFQEKSVKETWDPRRLPAVEEPDRIQKSSVIAEIFVFLALIAIFNFFPQWIGAVVSFEGQSGFLPLLGPEFKNHLPWLNIWWGLTVALNLVLFRQGHWHKATRWVDFGLSVFGTFVIFQLIRSAPIGLTPEWALRNGWSEPTLVQIDQQLLPSLSTLATGALTIGFIIIVVVAAGKFYKLIKRKSTEPWALQESSDPQT